MTTEQILCVIYIRNVHGFALSVIYKCNLMQSFLHFVQWEASLQLSANNGSNQLSVVNFQQRDWLM